MIKDCISRPRDPEHWGWWQVNENQEARFLSGRAEIIDELETSIPAWVRARNAQSWCPRYIHFLRVRSGQTTTIA